jgi:hypothetical protein
MAEKSNAIRKGVCVCVCVCDQRGEGKRNGVRHPTRISDLSMRRRAGATPGAKHRLAAAMTRPTRLESTTSCRLSRRMLLRAYASNTLSMVACRRLSRHGNEPLVLVLERLGSVPWRCWRHASTTDTRESLDLPVG